jgi:hypothetical protein
MEKFKLTVESVKTIATKSIKLSVYNDKLFVTLADSSMSKSKLDAAHNRSGQLLARTPGLAIEYIHPKFINDINEFLDAHFPGKETPELHHYEQNMSDELRFYGKGFPAETRTEISKVLVRIVSLAFPVLSRLMENRLNDGFYAFYRLDIVNYPHYRVESYKDFLLAEFGVYRKDLAKAVLNCNDTAVLWASKFTDIIDIDTIITALKKYPKRQGDDSRTVEAIRHFPKNTIRKLLEAGLSSPVDAVMIDDALEMASFVNRDEQKLCRTWKAVHDYGMMHYTNEQDEKGISHPTVFEKFFAEADFGERTIVPLRDSKSFIITGQIMDVCVGSVGYISRAFDGTAYCFRVDEGKLPYALVEVYSTDSGEWSIGQVYGQNNSILPMEFHQLLNKELSKFMNVKQKKKAENNA